MASVFLSYDREDSTAAELIARALEQTGHSVWWDRHIKGGAQYSDEIEEALNRAEAVVVLWSPSSVKSAWVRDEAGAGRDSGRLVPVMLKKTEPPMGFRQYQTIDLSRWKGRGRPPLEAVVAAIEGVSRITVDWSGEGSQKRHSIFSARHLNVRALAITILIVAFVGLAVVVWKPWRLTNSAPSLAVLPAEPNATARSLAADLLVKLQVLQSSRADTLQLVDVNSRRDPDLVIKVSSAVASGGAQANLMLVDNRVGALLWSGEFSEPSGGQADLRQQMAYSAAKVLDCAVQALSARTVKFELKTLSLYLNGCANLSNLLAQDPKAAIEIFAKVAAQEPRFEGAWKKLLLAEIQIMRAGGRSDPVVRKNLQNRIDAVRRFHPAIAEAFLAEAWLRSPRPLAGWISLVHQAVAKDPENADILAYQSLALSNVGLMQKALNAAHRAVESDPLSPSARDTLITALLNSGQIEAARNELEKSEQLWPGATSVLQAKFAIEFRVGDAAQALAMLQSGKLGPRLTPRTARARDAHESYLKARIEPTTKKRLEAIINARALYAQDPETSWVLARALSEFGDIDDLISFLLTSDARVPASTNWTLFRTSFGSLHRDRRFMEVAARLGLIDYWEMSGEWPDFCSHPDQPYDCRKEAARLTH